MTIGSASSRASASRGASSFLLRVSVPVGLAVVAGARRLAAAFVAWQDRRAVSSLYGLDDAMLADIGLSRADVSGALEVSLREKPSRLLVARVEERRAAERALAREARRAARNLGVVEGGPARDAAPNTVAAAARTVVRIGRDAA